VVEFDTGSPKLDVSIRLNLEAKIKWDITKLFSDFFKSVVDGIMADSMRIFKKISDQIDKNQKNDIKKLKSMKNELTPAEYQKRFLEIQDFHNELRKKQITVAIDNTSVTKRLESKPPMLIEDTSTPLPEMT
jgi:hypothetical protein